MADLEQKRIEPRTATPPPGDELRSTGRLPEDMLDEQVDDVVAAQVDARENARTSEEGWAAVVLRVRSGRAAGSG